LERLRRLFASLVRAASPGDVASPHRLNNRKSNLMLERWQEKNQENNNIFPSRLKWLQTGDWTGNININFDDGIKPPTSGSTYLVQ
jgi:hypothetical protein